MHQLDQIPVRQDEYLIDAIKQGGSKAEQAILHLYTCHAGNVKAIVYNLVTLHPVCRADAGDILHDAFLVMIHKIQSEPVEIISVKGYWVGIARGLILNHVKKQKWISLVEDVREDYASLDTDPETLFLMTEENQHVEKILSGSGKRCKEILLLWIEQYTMDEIASHLHLSGPKMARKIKYTCFKKIKSVIQKLKTHKPDDMVRHIE